MLGEAELAVYPYRQSNRSWLVTAPRGRAILKEYVWASVEMVDATLDAEELVRKAGLPAPAVLHRCADGRSVLYEHLPGEHLIPARPDLVDRCAELFVRQLEALDGFLPAAALPRPVLPRLAQRVRDQSADGELRDLVTASWHRLTELTASVPLVASHLDWRPDNLLFTGGEVTGIVDWETLGPLPAAEAVGYAAGLLTLSRRTGLDQPVGLPPVLRFLNRAAELLGWCGPAELAHARLAALHTCAVRLGEERIAGTAVVSLQELRDALDDGPVDDGDDGAAGLPYPVPA